MSLFLATLLVGLAFFFVGSALILDSSAIRAGLKALPRSKLAAYVFFGAASVWFLSRVAVLSEADFGQYRNYIFAGFATVAVLSLLFVSEFLAVRGLAGLVLLAAGPLLESAFGEYDIPSRLFMVTAVYVALTASLWLGAQPWRLRDAIEWMQRVPGRARWVGALVAIYGGVLMGVAFAY